MVVGSRSGGEGSFAITTSLGAPPVDDVCAGATPLLANMSTPAQTTLGYTNDYEATAASSSCLGPTFGPDRVYELSVPPGERASLVVTPLDGGLHPTLNFVDGPASTC